MLFGALATARGFLLRHRICNAACHMARWHMLRGVFDVARLIVKEEIWLELSQELALGQTAKEHGFVNTHAPVHQGANGAFVRRGAARGDQCRAQSHVLAARMLQAMKRRQQRLEGAIWQRQFGFSLFVCLKGGQAFFLENLLGFVGKKNRVAVKSDANLVRVVFASARRARGDPGCREAQRQCLPDIRFIGRKEKVRAQRLQIPKRIAPLGEHATFHAHASRRNAVKNPHAADRVVARQNHDFHALAIRLVERQQLLDQREGHPRRRRHIDALQLQVDIG